MIRLVAWRENEGDELRGRLEALGHEVEYRALDPGTLLRLIRDGSPPSAVVIDLSRSPAQGRDFGVALRVQASTRRLPLVFAGGLPEKVATVKRVLPDAVFTTWEEMEGALARALAGLKGPPVVPESRLAGYSGTPLPRKLGIKASTRVLLVGAPEGFADALGSLPEGVEIVRRYGPRVELTLWFVRSLKELEKSIDIWSGRVGRGGMWIIWPKKGSGVESDLTQALVRRTGLEHGLVDYKIASVDQTWSGLKFATRKGGGDG